MILHQNGRKIYNKQIINSIVRHGAVNSFKWICDKHPMYKFEYIAVMVEEERLDMLKYVMKDSGWDPIYFSHKLIRRLLRRSTNPEITRYLTGRLSIPCTTQ